METARRNKLIIVILLILTSQPAYMQVGESLLQRITLSAPEMELTEEYILEDVVIPITNYTDSIRTDKSVYQKFTMDINGEIDSTYHNEFCIGVQCIRFDGNIMDETRHPIQAKGIYIYKNNLFILDGNMIEKYFRRKPRKISVTFYQRLGYDKDGKPTFDYSCDWFSFIGIDGLGVFPWESNIPKLSHHEL
ncbi:MAG: hypothetical protein NC095_11515 [Muribaculum sp.]|nr:hypothetical protein [Muribaculum sp.]